MPAFRDLLAAAAIAAGFAALPACGDCKTSTQSRDATGALSFTSGDGARFAKGPKDESDLRVEHDAITVTATISGDAADGRKVALTLPTPVGQTGTFALDPSKASLCLGQSEDYPPLCVPLAGTLEIRQSGLDCTGNGSGVSGCVENLDAHLTASGEVSGAHVDADLTLLAVGSWQNSQCAED